MRTWYVALVVLVLGPAAAHAQGGWAQKMFKGKTTHDFGTVPRGAQLKVDFPITNIYAVPMEITEIKPSCGCVTAVPTKKVLASRETGTIEVRMDGRRFSGTKNV